MSTTREAMEQILIVCDDNAAAVCNQAMALTFVRQVAAAVLSASPQGDIECMMREALEPFAKYADELEGKNWLPDACPVSCNPRQYQPSANITVGDLRRARAALSAPPQGREDIRWAVNVLLETIAIRFEANDDWDIWRSDAAALVRSFKHDIASPPAITENSQEQP